MGESEDWMYPQISVFFSRFRLLFAGLLTMALFVAISALVTSIGSGSILDPHTHHTIVGTFDNSVAQTPNAVTSSINDMIDGTERTLLSAGTGLYTGCRSITATSKKTGMAITNGSFAVVRGFGNGTMFLARGVANGFMFSARTAGTGMMYIFRTAGAGVMFTVHLPTRLTGSIASGHAVSAIIKSDDDKPVPIISSETSAATLASLSAQQRSQIADWQSAQLAANQRLDGTILAGDPAHGGYPAKWDNARQDSMVDQWGMYSRECVSYTAWKVYQTYGDMPYWGGVGNANQWVGDAQRAGIATGTAPKAGSVAIWRVGYYGHAMWVEKVDGNMIYVSQYNYDLNGHYSEMWVNGSNFTYIYFK
jgi:surface antigen